MSQELVQLSLKDFIKSTLIDINQGVIEAVQEGIPLAYAQHTTGPLPMMKSVEFDIAVQVTENNILGKNSEGGIGISVVNLKSSKENKTTIQQENINRIKFAVDMFLGRDKKEQIGKDKKVEKRKPMGLSNRQLAENAMKL